MSLKYIANTDLTVSFISVAVPPGATYAGDPGIDAVKIKPTISDTSKAGGSYITTDKIVIKFTAATGGCPYSASGYTFVSGGTTITASADKVKVDGLPVLRVEDKSLLGCTGSWTVDSGGTFACSCKAKIASAGQDKVKGQ